MNEHIRNKNWSETALGPVEQWPHSLRVALNICLASEAPSCMCWGEDFVFVCNDAWKDLFGEDYSFALGQPARELLKEEWETFYSSINHVFSERKMAKAKNQSLSFSGGTERQFDFSFSPLPDENENVGGVFITGTEASELSQVVEALRKSEQKYRTLFESMDEAYCIIKVLFDENENPVDFKYLEVNPSFEEHTGLKDIEGKRISEEVPELEDTWFETYAKVALTGESMRFERYSEEMQRWFDVYAFQIGDPQEQKVAVLFSDITERKQADKEREKLLKEVKAEKEKLTNIFKQAPSFMCIMEGPDHVFKRANDLYRQLVGDREIIGKPAREAIPESVEQGFIDLLDDVYETGEPYRGQDVEVILHKDGDIPEKHYLDFVYQPLRNPNGEITGIFVQGIDLTERHKAKEQLEEINETLEERVEKRTKKLRSYQKQLQSLASKLNKAEEMERQRLASELHDKLGQMLTVAKMQVDSLEFTHFPESTPSDVKELKKVVSDALDYNQNLMSELKPPPALDKEDVTEVLYWTIQKMEKQGLDIVVKDDGRPKPVEKEIRIILHQSVRELLLNVAKHADTNSARVELKRIDNQIQITIVDKGSGFTMEEKRPQPTKEGGFGLFNIQERMDWHGGDFEIDSQPGVGTTATLIAPLKNKSQTDMPVLDDDEEFSISSGKEHKVELGRQIKVMLVDDHDMVRRGLRQLIEKQEDLMILAEASDGEEAINLARKMNPDIIVMDVNMPVLDGIEATQKIKSDMPDVQIIGLSLHDSQEVKEDMHSAGASAYLTKNEAFETLCATIRKEMSAAAK